MRIDYSETYIEEKNVYVYRELENGEELELEVLVQFSVWPGNRRYPGRVVDASYDEDYGYVGEKAYGLTEAEKEEISQTVYEEQGAIDQELYDCSYESQW